MVFERTSQLGKTQEKRTEQRWGKGLFSGLLGACLLVACGSEVPLTTGEPDFEYDASAPRMTMTSASGTLSLTQIEVADGKHVFAGKWADLVTGATTSLSIEMPERSTSNIVGTEQLEDGGTLYLLKDPISGLATNVYAWEQGATLVLVVERMETGRTAHVVWTNVGMLEKSEETVLAKVSGQDVIEGHWPIDWSDQLFSDNCVNRTDCIDFNNTAEKCYEACVDTAPDADNTYLNAEFNCTITSTNYQGDSDYECTCDCDSYTTI